MLHIKHFVPHLWIENWYLTHWGRDKMAAISQTTLSVTFSWMKMFEFRYLRFVPKGPANTIPALVQIMAWRHPGDKPLSEPMMVSLTTHICVTRPQWAKPTRDARYSPWHWSLMTSLGMWKSVRPHYLCSSMWLPLSRLTLYATYKTYQLSLLAHWIFI